MLFFVNFPVLNMGDYPNNRILAWLASSEPQRCAKES